MDETPFWSLVFFVTMCIFYGVDVKIIALAICLTIIICRECARHDEEVDFDEV